MRGTAAYLITVLLLFTTSVAKAQELDSAYLARVQDTVDRYYDRHPRKRLSSEDRRFAVMPLYGVMYTQETGLLAMGGFMGSYRSSADTLVPESSVGAVAMLSVNLSGAGAVMGKWYSGPGNFLLEYSVIFKNSPRRFWGLGYADASDECNLTSFTGRNLRAEAQFLYRGGRRILAGGLAGYDYSDAVDFGSDALVDGLPLRSHYLYAGVRFSYDSRDDTSEPSRGVFLEAVQKRRQPRASADRNYARAERKPVLHRVRDYIASRMFCAAQPQPLGRGEIYCGSAGYERRYENKKEQDAVHRAPPLSMSRCVMTTRLPVEAIAAPTISATATERWRPPVQPKQI